MATTTDIGAPMQDTTPQTAAEKRAIMADYYNVQRVLALCNVCDARPSVTAAGYCAQCEEQRLAEQGR